MNETEHYKQAERWLEDAETFYREGDSERAELNLRFAEVHAHLSVAADVDREADAESRLAACVPDGGSRMQVAVNR